VEETVARLDAEGQILLLISEVVEELVVDTRLELLMHHCLELLKQ
jgi:hypothetical protein